MAGLATHVGLRGSRRRRLGRPTGYGQPTPGAGASTTSTCPVLALMTSSTPSAPRQTPSATFGSNTSYSSAYRESHLRPLPPQRHRPDEATAAAICVSSGTARLYESRTFSRLRERSGMLPERGAVDQPRSRSEGRVDPVLTIVFAYFSRFRDPFICPLPAVAAARLHRRSTFSAGDHGVAVGGPLSSSGTAARVCFADFSAGAPVRSRWA